MTSRFRAVFNVPALLVTLLLTACGGSGAPATTTTPLRTSELQTGKADNPYPGYASTLYAGTNNWLCHPELGSNRNFCFGDIRASAIKANGDASETDVLTDANAPVDCFYVYPTASPDPSVNSDLITDAQEQQTTTLQFARYRSLCRQFAPVYRQRTLGALALRSQGGAVLPPEFDAQAPVIAYADVLDAFKQYISQHNQGRGFLLVGHSQGSALFKRLIAEEIEAKPYLLERFIGAHMPGINVQVKKGELTGGTFRKVKGCTRADESGCVIAYSSYRKDDPQLANPRYGLADKPTEEVLCVNPATLIAEDKGVLEPYLPKVLPPVFQALLIPRGTGGPYQNPVMNATLPTPFYTMPNQLSAACRTSPINARYLEVSILADPQDPRADDYPGEFIGGSNWGLHLADVNVAQGNLVRIAKRQIQTWLREGNRPDFPNSGN